MGHEGCGAVKAAGLPEETLKDFDPALCRSPWGRLILLAACETTRAYTDTIAKRPERPERFLVPRGTRPGVAGRRGGPLLVRPLATV
jgi:hypothetical protein